MGLKLEWKINDIEAYIRLKSDQNGIEMVCVSQSSDLSPRLKSDQNGIEM